MTPEERQAELDKISIDDLEKIKKATSKVKVDIEDFLLAEFAMKFGWNAYQDVKLDRIKAREMMKLLSASRKLDSVGLYRQSEASFIGGVSSQTKYPAKTFKKLTKNIRKDAEVDNG